MPPQLSGRQRQHITCDLIHTYQRFGGRSSLEQRSDSGQNLAAASTVPPYSLQGLSSLGEVWWIGCEPIQPGIGACDYTSERLIDFVRDGGCQLAHRGDSANRLQFRPGLVKGRLSALALSDVNHSTSVLNEIAGRAENRMTSAVDVPDGSTRMDDAIFRLPLCL